MRRRDFIKAIAGSAAAWPIAAPKPADAQTAKPSRVGLLTLNAPGPSEQRLAAFRKGMREYGYREGETVIFEIRYGEGRVDRLPALAADLVRHNVDVLVPAGYPAIRAAQQAAGTTPIVVAIMSDPVEEGFAASYTRPGGNLTGLAFQDADLTTKRLELLKEIVPSLSHVAVLWDPGMPTSLLNKTESAARSLGLQLEVLPAADAAQLEAAFDTALARKVQAVFQVASPRLSALAGELSTLTVKKRLPAACEQGAFVAAGCLVSYGPSFEAMYRRSAYYVDRVLKGTKPADLPIEEPTKFELAINLKTARVLGLSVSPAVLFRADQVIE